MKKIGVLFGMENSFPPALVEHINALKVPGISAEAVCVGGVQLNKPAPYAVIVDRISHDIPFYRAYLKHAAISGGRRMTSSLIARLRRRWGLRCHAR